MAWRRPGDKPLSEPMMVNLKTHICVPRPQWVNEYLPSVRIDFNYLHHILRNYRSYHVWCFLNKFQQSNSKHSPGWHEGCGVIKTLSYCTRTIMGTVAVTQWRRSSTYLFMTNIKCIFPSPEHHETVVLTKQGEKMFFYNRKKLLRYSNIEER